MKKLTGKLAALITAAAMGMTALTMSVSAEIEDDLSDGTEFYAQLVEDDVPVPVPADDIPMFTLPTDMRAAVITPAVDFFGDDEPDQSLLANELDNIYSEFAELGLNTVIINTMNGDTPYYNIDAGAPECDPITAAITSAYESGISPYVVFDIGHALSDTRSGSEAIDTLVSKIHRFTLRYPCSGILLDDYYVRRNVSSFGEYMENGSGIGYNNWLYDSAEQYFSTAADIIRNTDNSVAVGFIINDMWANSSVNEEGSETSDAVQAFYDGHADTKSFIEKGYVDFAVLRTYGSLTSQTLPYEKVTGWWGSLTDAADIPLYILHHNEFIGTDRAGWGSADQLLKQLSVAKEIRSYSGSAFNSLESLKKDPLGSTEALVSYYNEQIDESSLFEGLKMTSPSSLTFTTTEPTVAFMGTFDSNFPVYFNGEEIRLNDVGNFYFERPLSDGMNKFTISHKDKSYTYSITRKITVLKSIGAAISDGKSLTVDGGTKINLTAKAYKGANVYGIVNGVTVPMSESESADEEEVNSSYVRYTGTYTAPEGIVGQAQQLGKIQIFASYSGYSMSAAGASVTVNAKPEPPKQAEVVMAADADDIGSGEVLATLGASHVAGETVKFVKVLADNTIVYDGKTADDIPSPLFSQLPAGTLEVYRSTSGSYYVTESGKRIAASASSLEEGTAITDNPLAVKSIGTSNGNSYIKMSLGRKTGFNMRLAGNNYYTAWDGDYNVKNFTATHLYITFENVTSVTALPSFEHNLVFRSGKWDTVTEDNGTKFRLILELRQPGTYFGHAAKYDANGDLVLSFPVPVNSISGLTVVIDPGHGYGKSAAILDPGAIGEVVEQEVVLEISKELEKQLKEAGANVIRLKTESEFLLTKERPIYARGLGCDIYISIHANKALGDARGAEAYYFTSWSEPLAAEISKGIASYYQTSVYTDGADRDRGARYSYYHVTLQQDFPSVLVETGFVDNIQDAVALASPTHRAGIAAGIVRGIKNYLARSSISYAAEGYSAAKTNEAAVTLPAVTTAPEETAAAPAQQETTGSDEIEDEEESDVVVVQDEEEGEEEPIIPEKDPEPSGSDTTAALTDNDSSDDIEDLADDE